MGNRNCCACEGQEAESVTAINAQGYRQFDPDETLDTKRSVVTVLFQLPNGSTKEINFTSRPWGIDFTKSTPVTVKRVRSNSHASVLGVQVDWVALKVCNKDLPDEFVAAMKLIQVHVLSLPESK
mmetsp:Transcript_143987/g.203725  ORF Transcript_143987/g.203725 Transcript_143987/m.203725 type:complete len:125 (+) Transcript_143987:92-466(+)